MKKLALLLLLLSSFAASGQHPLSQGRRSSVYEYLYALSNEEALQIFSHGPQKINNNFLHTLKDSFPHDNGVPADLAPGNYLRVYAVNDQLKTVFLHVPGVNIKVTGNSRDLLIILHDTKGNLVKDAQVRIGKHMQEYNTQAGSWVFGKYERPHLLQVYYKGVLHCIRLKQSGLIYRVSTWKYLVRKIQNVRRAPKWARKRRHYNDWNTTTDYERKHRGYMVFSKPIYKPGDTLKVKAYITDKKGNPVNKPLLLRVNEFHGSIDTVLATLTPYTPGGYSYEVALTPDLGLSVDEDYMITLETTDSPKFDRSKHDGNDEDEDEYVAKRKVLIKEDFSYEEYELHTLSFTARTDKKLHTGREEVAVYLQAKDENELPVMDGQVQLFIIKPVIKTCYSKDLFVPDTLWQYKGTIDAVGETKVAIPDSVFPKADLLYQINCILTNSNNERKSATLNQEYRYNEGRFSFNMRGDSLYISMKGSANPDEKVRIYGLDKKQDTVETYEKQLPTAIKINRFLSTYEVRRKNVTDSYTLEATSDILNTVVSWRNDTVAIYVDNPYKQAFWYTIFERSKVVLRGYGDTLAWQASTSHNKQYDLRISYIWNGRVHEISRTFRSPGGRLTLTMEAPKTIHPGQTSEITVNVRDKYQQPVAQADVTAYAYTSKFTDDKFPKVPIFQTPLKTRKYYAGLSADPIHISSSTLPFEWERYGKRLGLDSLLFFRFTHPSPVFIHTEPTNDHTAQIAPFVFARGSLQPVHILYVDEVPVYYSMTYPLQPYSIRVPAGKHKICFRTPYQQIRMEQTFADSMKTFISIDSAIHRPDVLVESMPQKLTPAEAIRVEKYLIRVRNNFGNSPVYIRQQHQLYDMNTTSFANNMYSSYIVGPLNGATATLQVKDEFTQDFMPEPGYFFEFSKGLIKQKEISSRREYQLGTYMPDTSLSAQALTTAGIDSSLNAIQEDRLRYENINYSKRDTKSTTSRLSIRLENADILPMDVLCYIFFRYDNPSFQRSFSGITTNFEHLDSGYYRLITLLTNNRHFVKDSLLLKENHLHCYTFDTLSILPNDSFITNLGQRLRQGFDPKRLGWAPPKYGWQTTEGYSADLINKAQLTRVISGFVVDENDDPLIGASVMLRGSKSGIATDGDGRFTLHVTPSGTLDITYVGFAAVEQRLNNSNFYKFTLKPIEQYLQEIAVTAWGVSRKQKALGYAVSTITSEQIKAAGYTSFAEALYGKAAGVKITTAPMGSPLSKSFGENYIAAADNPREGGQPPTPPANSLRTNFRDDAFWQPRLRTDANGNASFKVTFPDDITNWKTYAIAMNGNKQSGISRTFIPSYKTLSGNLALPTFTVAGDSIMVISKALNYTPETIAATHTFQVNDSTYHTGNISLKDAVIDTVPVTINDSDSVSFKYTLNKEGYMDGEQRKIPIVRRGTEETSGMFAALYNDTSFTYVPEHQEQLEIHAESAVLPVLMNEITQVQRYKYLCNEQLASKLKAYLLEMKVANYLKKDFDKYDDIDNILEKLNRQKKNGLWGWWASSPVSMWISRHVIEALLLAEELNYKTDFNKQVAIDYFVDKLNSGKEQDSIGCMQLLASLGAKIDYAGYIDSIISRSGKNGYDTIRLAVLQQQSGLPVNISPILSREKNTAFGNAYWGNESYDLFDNSIQKTLQVYKLLRKNGGHAPLLQKIRGYLLEQRKDGYWRNTYESSLILETILPDVLEDESQGPAALDINDRHITQFPYTDTLTQAGKINISKQGKRPVYFTAYQQYFNPQPEEVSGLFTVSSVFSTNGNTQKDLKAGVPTTLKVEVTVHKTADYVLIEIPIPAGCSYQDKSQSWANNEVHREHFKDRVSIFCSQLRPGTYTFNVSLLPRYSGRYSLNPAKAEMQYFPVFMGREALKKVDIQ